MFALLLLSLLVLLQTVSVYAAPSAVHTLERRAVTQLTSAQIASFEPYTQFAKAAYCRTSVIEGWKCGSACNALPDFELGLVGGDGDAVQTYFVGYWPSRHTVVVAHEGTDPTQFLSDLTDLNAFLGNLDSTLFPGVPSSVQVHDGFRNEHAKTASVILAEVKKLLASTGATSVTCVGHSLGGALAQLDSLLFAIHIPSSVAIKVVTYGMPRVGNPAYAAYFDSKVQDFQRVNNERDIIPIVPGEFMGYRHTHGEVHLLSPSYAVACPGNDDAIDRQCQIQSVPNIFAGNILNHLGPYQGLYLGTVFCN